MWEGDGTLSVARDKRFMSRNQISRAGLDATSIAVLPQLNWVQNSVYALDRRYMISDSSPYAVLHNLRCYHNGCQHLDYNLSGGRTDREPILSNTVVSSLYCRENHIGPIPILESLTSVSLTATIASLDIISGGKEATFSLGSFIQLT